MARRYPDHVEVLVEVPRGAFVKRELHTDTVDYVSPLPSPFNYGCVPEIPGEDGDPLDALLMGRRRRLGERVRGPVWGVVLFVDAGAPDPKLVVGVPGPAELQALQLFFRIYAPLRRALNRVRGLSGDTRFLGLERV